MLQRIPYFLFLILPVCLKSQENNFISVAQETQVLSKGVKSIFRCDIYYNKVKDAITTRHIYPAEFINQSNRYGETKLYYPKDNTVSVHQDQSLSTTNELLYYFINNRLNDLGLAKEGFKLISTTNEEGMIVTMWQAPVSLKVIDKIKVVFKDFVPVYSEYLTTGGLILKKIYYSRYSDFKSFKIPMRITEISFESRTDSTIRLSVFSNVKVTDTPDGDYFNFKIPDDARIVK
jgi:hypothetical protein